MNRHTQAETDMLCCMLLLLFFLGLMVAHGKEAHHNRACTEAHGSKRHHVVGTTVGQEARAHPHENPGPETSHDIPNSELQLQVGLQDDKSESTMPSTAEPSRGTTPKERPTQTKTHTGCNAPATEGHNRQKSWRTTISRILTAMAGRHPKVVNEPRRHVRKGQRV